MKTTAFWFLISILIISNIQCSRERIEPKEQINEYDPIQSYFNTKKQPEQELLSIPMAHALWWECKEQDFAQ